MSNNAYKTENYYRYPLMMPKSGAEALKAKAAQEGVTLNRYILEAVEARSGLKLTLDNALPWMDPNKRKSEEGEK